MTIRPSFPMAAISFIFAIRPRPRTPASTSVLSMPNPRSKVRNCSWGLPSGPPTCLLSHADSEIRAVFQFAQMNRLLGTFKQINKQLEHPERLVAHRPAYPDRANSIHRLERRGFFLRAQRDADRR